MQKIRSFLLHWRPHKTLGSSSLRFFFPPLLHKQNHNPIEERCDDITSISLIPNSDTFHWITKTNIYFCTLCHTDCIVYLSALWTVTVVCIWTPYSFYIRCLCLCNWLHVFDVKYTLLWFKHRCDDYYWTWDIKICNIIRLEIRSLCFHTENHHIKNKNIGLKQLPCESVHSTLCINYLHNHSVYSCLVDMTIKVNSKNTDIYNNFCLSKVSARLAVSFF